MKRVQFQVNPQPVTEHLVQAVAGVIVNHVLHSGDWSWDGSIKDIMQELGVPTQEMFRWYETYQTAMEVGLTHGLFYVRPTHNGLIYSMTVQMYTHYLISTKGVV